MRRHRLHLAAATLAAAAVLLVVTPAGAQTTTTTTAPPATTVPTTVPVTTPASTLSPATQPATATTVAPVGTTAPAATTGDDGGSSIPWIPIAVGVLVIIALVVIIAIVSRKRGAARQLVADWKRRAADATADTAERARRSLQTLGLAIDSDYRLRRRQGVDPRQLAQSQESVQNAASETDRTLRGVYRSFTGAE